MTRSRRPAPLVIAIDGPSGVGKTTVARAVARNLGIPYLGTGSMYRAVALEVLERNVDPADREAVERLASSLDLGFGLDRDGFLEVRLAGEPVGERIQGLRVAQVTSQISVYRGVRRRMVELQREWAGRHGAVVEGRDIGTRVFPSTPHKFFLDAPLEVRAERRWRELEEREGVTSREDVVREVAERDARDTQRADSPLTCDETYQRVDTGRYTAPQVVDLIVAAVSGQ